MLSACIAQINSVFQTCTVSHVQTNVIPSSLISSCILVATKLFNEVSKAHKFTCQAGASGHATDVGC